MKGPCAFRTHGRGRGLRAPFGPHHRSREDGYRNFMIELLCSFHQQQLSSCWLRDFTTFTLSFLICFNIFLSF